MMALASLTPRTRVPMPPPALDSGFGRLAVAAAPASPGDTMADRTIAALLALLEEHFGMRLVVVAPLAHDLPRLHGGQAGYRLPLGRGSIGVPIQLADGRIQGMLCWLRRDEEPALAERDIRRIEMAARLAARLLDGADAHGVAAFGV